MADKNIHSDEIVMKINTPVAVVVLNWNGAALLEKFLPSVVENTDPTLATVVVADNGSTDNSLALLDEKFSGIKVLAFDRNNGFAEGYNMVCRMVAAPYIVLLNSDAAPAKGWIKPLYDFMERNGDYAACQPKLLSYNEPEKFEYAGAAGGFIDRHGYPYCRGRIFDTCESDNGQYDTEAELHWASGAALMVRRDLYNGAGGLDSGFFAHMEEIDLCWRLRRMGYKIGYVWNSIVYHLGGGSLPPSSPRKAYLNFRNNLLMLYKNLPVCKRRGVLLRRRLLDSLAWANFIAHGKFKSASAIIKAHNDFRKMRKNYPDRDDVTRFKDDAPVADVNIITQYYLKGRKTFDRLPSVLLAVAVALTAVFGIEAKILNKDQARSLVTQFVEQMGSLDRFLSGAIVTYSTPDADTPTTYHLDIYEKKDTVAGHFDNTNYFINWKTDENGTEIDGFDAFFTDTLGYPAYYRYRNRDVQEYHYPADSVSMGYWNGGNGHNPDGLQWQTPFGFVLPVSVAGELGKVLTPGFEGEYTVEVPDKRDGKGILIITVQDKINGVEGAKWIYEFLGTHYLWLDIKRISPSGINGSQETRIIYWDASPNGIDFDDINEQFLDNNVGKVMKMARDKAYRLKQLKYEALPPFTALSTTYERYVYEKNRGFARPAALVFMNTSADGNRKLIEQVRQKYSRRDILWMWSNKNIDEIESQLTELMPGEFSLISTAKYADSLGIEDFPTIILVEPDGKVKDILKINDASVN